MNYISIILNCITLSVSKESNFKKSIVIIKTSEFAVEVLKDIADVERVHAGEFLRLLREISSDEDKFYADGAKDVEAQIRKMK